MLNPETSGKPEDQETIIYIEYDDEDIPYLVITVYPNQTSKYYDFDWCKKHGLYYHESGGGWDLSNGICISQFCDTTRLRKIFLEEEFYLVDEDSTRLTNEQIKSMGYQIIENPIILTGIGEDTDNPFVVGYEGETIWCTICQTNYPAEEYSECRHLFWGAAGWWDGVGYDHPIDSVKKEILFFMKKIQNIEVLINALQADHMDICEDGSLDTFLIGEKWQDSVELFDVDEMELTDDEEELFDTGLNWLRTIGDETTKEANAKVLSWIKEKHND